MRCIDTDSACVGEEFLYTSMSGATQSWRCEGHYQTYVERLSPIIEDINRRYPRQAPADFDPAYAGESWDDPDCLSDRSWDEDY